VVVKLLLFETSNSSVIGVGENQEASQTADLLPLKESSECLTMSRYKRTSARLSWWSHLL